MAEMNGKSDREMDQEWKPNNRPESIMAQNFAASLDKIFDLDNSLGPLSENVEDKRQNVTLQSRELQELEARLRVTEERIKRSTSPNPAAQEQQQHAPRVSSLASAQPGPSTEHTQSQSSRQPPTYDSSNSTANATPGSGEEQQYSARNLSERSHQSPYASTSLQDMPGAMPATPRSYTGSDYVMVDRARAS